MTKNERIGVLEHKVASLEAHLSALSERAKALEARPSVVNVHNTPSAPLKRQPPSGPYTCTCGSTAGGICPLHGYGNWSWAGGTTMDVTMGYKS